ncbi:MAG: LacI family transcriptional regulator [Opitutaceae bacterium]|jgi:LacI family transcriptional regulator|nr:LacI family transcriptional regulator [Opitutaceae bacterium]
MSDSSPLSIRDLAARLGISRSAVSMALRNHPRVSAATRQRVQAEAARLGYRPNAMVTALMAQIRTRRVKRSGEVIAFLTAWHNADEWRKRTPFLGTFEGASEQAERLGFRLEPCWLGPLGSDSRRVARILRARAVRGVIIAPMPLDLGVLELDWERQLTVAIGYSFAQQTLHRVNHNQFNIMLSCYENLRRLGHRRIGLAIPRESDDRVHHFWMAGFYTAQQIHGDEPLPVLWLDDWHDRPDLRKQYMRWYRAHKPDAVLGILPDNPLRWMREEGVRVPARTSYASLDLDRTQIGEVAGVLQSVEAVGAAAVDLVVSGLNRNEHGIPENPKLLLMDGVWRDGATAQHFT